LAIKIEKLQIINVWLNIDEYENENKSLITDVNLQLISVNIIPLELDVFQIKLILKRF